MINYLPFFKSWLFDEPLFSKSHFPNMPLFDAYLLNFSVTTFGNCPEVAGTEGVEETYMC